MQDRQDTTTSFETKTLPPDLTTEKEKASVSIYLLNTIVREYLGQERIVKNNMDRVYGFIWGRCTPDL